MYERAECCPYAGICNDLLERTTRLRIFPMRPRIPTPEESTPIIHHLKQSRYDGYINDICKRTGMYVLAEEICIIFDFIVLVQQRKGNFTLYSTVFSIVPA